MRRWIMGFVVAVAILAAPVAPALDLDAYPELQTFIAEVSRRHGFDPQQLARVLAAANLKDDIIAAIERPREALPYFEYRKGFLTASHVQRGLEHWQRHAPALARAQERYGVPPEYVLGILGVETHYGRNNGQHRVVDALVTLTLRHPPRADFFRKELEEFLVLARELGWKPLDIKGSYAGAMGIPQFMPSSYRRFAVDHDGDGQRDLLKNHADAIGSVAHYLQRHGWTADHPVVIDARLEGTHFFWIEKLGLKPALTLRDLMGYGIFPMRAVGDDHRAALVELEDDSGPAYQLAFDNFYAVTRYNRSKRYAMAVTELAETLRARHAEGRAP